MESIAEVYGYVIFDLVDDNIRKFIPYKYNIVILESLEIITKLYYN
jgi:hypothetical protein